MTRSVEGVYVGTHTLSRSAEKLESLCRRVMNRLSYSLNQTHKEQSLPSPEWIEAFRYIQACILGLLKEQRERAKLTAGADITDEQLQAQFREEMAKALETFGPKEREFAMELWARSPVHDPGKRRGEVQ